VSARARVILVVALAASAAAGIAVGATLLTRSSSGKPPSGSSLRAGAPPLLLDLGVRADPEAVALRRASALYANGKRKAAGAIFGRYTSLAARIGAAFSTWPEKTAAELDALARTHPRDSLVQLHRGLALYWSGKDAAAVTAWQSAKRVEPDTPSAVYADNLLHPSSPPGLPVFVPSFPPPAGIASLPPQRQLATLARAAAVGGARAKILYGVALQRLQRPLSAEREFAAAARLARRDPDAQVAAAVGLFDKDHPERAFARLGPLVRAYPRAPTVRFHLGLMLLWLRQIDKAKAEFRKARAEGPRTALGREAESFLKGLAKVGTNTSSK
jgi:tetratricopeptide (TPR) repeat protein